MYLNQIEGKGGISAKMVADSVANGIRLCTLELRYPRFIHSEFMTHRMFSRNASSSRAIPVEKVLKQVEDSPAMPIHWGKNQPGMQAKEEVLDIFRPIDRWQDSRDCAVVQCNDMLYVSGVHKQVVNRLTEPFQFIKVVVSATQWDNFFHLRLHPDAQPEIFELARVMKQSMEGSVPNLVTKGFYHLPYIQKIEHGLPLGVLTKCSVARCARVSYMNHDNSSPDIEKDIQLHDMLKESEHMSPFEHVATPMVLIDTPGYWNGADEYVLQSWERGVTHTDREDNMWSGNFRGWIQYRNLL